MNAVKMCNAIYKAQKQTTEQGTQKYQSYGNH